MAVLARVLGRAESGGGGAGSDPNVTAQWYGQ